MASMETRSAASRLTNCFSSLEKSLKTAFIACSLSGIHLISFSVLGKQTAAAPQKLAAQQFENCLNGMQDYIQSQNV